MSTRSPESVVVAPHPDGARGFASATDLPGVVLFSPPVYRDPRGFFREVWRADRYTAAGIREAFVQDNVSYSQRGVLRGLHFQEPEGQGKLVSALMGAVCDVVVDVRLGSPTFGRSECFELSEQNGRQLYVPPGFAHGFVVLSEVALFAYKCTAYYSPAHERVVMWNDPELRIDWPADLEFTVSPRDAAGRPLREFAPDELPRWR